MRIIDSLDDIADRYDALFCDVWGVVHNGRAPFAPAVAALQRFREKGGRVLLLTNVPKPRDPIPGHLDRIGVARDAWDAIVTSGDAIRAELAKRAPGPMLKIGPPHDAILWDGLGLAQSELADAKFIAISGLNRDGEETPEDYLPLLREARTRDMELLCANPDLVVRFGDKLYPCAGAIALEYEKLGGRVVMAGKPFQPIYDLAFEELNRIAGRAIAHDRILAIGDSAATDVKGANGAGLDCLFVADGIHGAALMTGGVLDPTKADVALAKEGVRADYAMPGLA
ncbi:MAG: TIGR01459 family HAD-type hydrolase [Hyphomonadaceae bacterium]